MVERLRGPPIHSLLSRKRNFAIVGLDLTCSIVWNSPSTFTPLTTFAATSFFAAEVSSINFSTADILFLLLLILFLTTSDLLHACLDEPAMRQDSLPKTLDALRLSQRPAQFAGSPGWGRNGWMHSRKCSG